MPWSGGSYTKGNSGTGGWAGDAAAGIGIEAGRHDTQDNDFATGINQCLNKDGSNSATADLNFGGFKPSNVAAGTAAAPAYCPGNDANTGIYSIAADTLGVSTNGVERTRWTSAGLVGINKAAPDQRLHIGSGNAIEGAIIDGNNSGTSGGAFWLVRNNGANICGIGNFSALFGGAYNATSTLWSNSVGWRVTNLGTGAGTHAMRYDNGSGAWTYDTSSIRYKEDVTDCAYGLDTIVQMKARTFKYKDSGRADVGFIAEEVAPLIPELVPLDKNGQPDGVSYDRLTAVLCKAIQELNSKVEALTAKVTALESVTNEVPAIG
jgi:hypothetical protein